MNIQNAKKYLENKHKAGLSKRRREKAKEIMADKDYKYGDTLTIIEAAAYTKLSPSTLSNYRMGIDKRSRQNKVFIPYIKMGRIIRYKKSDLDDFLNGRSIGGEYITGGTPKKENK